MAVRWSERIGCRIKLRDLHVLLAVAQNRSIARAAQHLGVSQPVVSRVIGELEQTIGVQLFERDRHGAEPTVYGAALLKRGAAAFEELRRGLQDIELLADPTAGEVRVGGTEPVLEGIIPAVIGHVYRLYPRLTVYLTQLPAGAQRYRDLRERNVDFVVGRVSLAGMERDLAVEILFDDPVAIAVGKQNKLASRRRIEVAELLDAQWVLPPPDSAGGALIADTFRACGLDAPRAAVVCNFVHMLSTLLTTGPFVAMLPQSYLRFRSQRLSIRTLPVKLPVEPRPVGLVTLKDRALGPAAQLFVDCVRDVVRPLTGNR